MVRITNQSQGRVLSFAGDRVMSVFALNGRNKTVDAAIMCALSIHSIVRKILSEEFTERNFKPEFSCSIGIDYRRVLMERFGAGKTTDVVLVGDAANLAAKHQSVANPDHTIVSNEVYNSFPDWLTLDYWKSDDIDVTGFGNIQVYESNSFYTIE